MPRAAAAVTKSSKAYHRQVAAAAAGVGDPHLLGGFAVKGYSEFPAELVQSLQDSAFALPATCSADFFCPAVDPLATESAAAAPKVLAVGGSLALIQDWLPSPYIVCLHARHPDVTTPKRTQKAVQNS